MVQDGAEAVDGLVVREGVLEALGYRDSQGPGMVGVLREELPADLRRGARARVDLRAVQAHERPALDLPVVHGADPVDRRTQADEGGGVREGGPPLPRPRLRGQALETRGLRVPGLGEGRVDLVAPRGAEELRLVVQLRGRLEGRLEPPGADQGAGAEGVRVQVEDLLGDRHPAFRGGLLAETLPEEHVGEGLHAGRALLGVLRGRERLRQVRPDVVPSRRQIVDRQKDHVGRADHATRSREPRAAVCDAGHLRLSEGPREGGGTSIAQGRGSSPVDLNAIPISAIERVEVLRGPSSVLYGNSAGGVLTLACSAFIGDGEDGGPDNSRPCARRGSQRRISSAPRFPFRSGAAPVFRRDGTRVTVTFGPPSRAPSDRMEAPQTGAPKGSNDASPLTSCPLEGARCRRVPRVARRWNGTD